MDPIGLRRDERLAAMRRANRRLAWRLALAAGLCYLGVYAYYLLQSP